MSGIKADWFSILTCVLQLDRRNNSIECKGLQAGHVQEQQTKLNKGNRTSYYVAANQTELDYWDKIVKNK